MKMLFIHGGSRWRIDEDGKVYNDGTYNINIWNRYLSYCDELTVLLRSDSTVYSRDEAKKRFNAVSPNITPIMLPDLYKPTNNYFKLNLHKQIKEVIREEIDKADCVIIRSLCNIYANTAMRYCKRINKRFLAEVTGFEFDFLWYHSLKGKLVAPFNEIKYKLYMRNVKYALYVTQEALQKRYPGCGENFGCSDVEIYEYSPSIFEKRRERIEAEMPEKKLILGTAASLDVKWKKEENVIKAIYRLRKKGFDFFEYEMVGNGNGKRLKKLINKYKLSDTIRIVGEIPHEKIYKWLDSIDIYVHPSYGEGLCRAIAEAMSRACPVICCDVGGNSELVPGEFLYRKRDISKLCDLLIMMKDREVRLKAATENFNKIEEYTEEKLQKRRDYYYRKFVNGE